MDFEISTISFLINRPRAKVNERSCRNTWAFVRCNIYFPLVFALFIYDIFSEDNRRKTKIILYSAITLGLFALFCAITFFSEMNVDFNTYYQYLQGRTTESIDLSTDWALYYEYYAKMPEHISTYVEPIWKYNIARFVLTLIVLAPLFIMFWLPWIYAIRHAPTKSDKWCYILMQCSLNVIILPAYIMAVDYMRWTYAYLFGQCALLLFMIYREEPIFMTFLDKCILFVRENVYRKQYMTLLLFLIIYTISWGKIGINLTMPFVDTLCNIFGFYYNVEHVVPASILYNAY